MAHNGDISSGNTPKHSRRPSGNGQGELADKSAPSPKTTQEQAPSAEKSSADSSFGSGIFDLTLPSTPARSSLLTQVLGNPAVMARFGNNPSAATILLELSSSFYPPASDKPRDTYVQRRARKFAGWLGSPWCALPNLFPETDGKTFNVQSILMDEVETRGKHLVRIQKDASDSKYHPDRHWNLAHEVLLLAGRAYLTTPDRSGSLRPLIDFSRHVYGLLSNEPERDYWKLHVNSVLGAILGLEECQRRGLSSGVFGFHGYREHYPKMAEEADKLLPLTEQLLAAPSLRVDPLKYLSRATMRQLYDIYGAKFLPELEKPAYSARVLVTRNLSERSRMEIAVQQSLSKPKARLQEALLDAIALTVVLVDPILGEELPTGRAVPEDERRKKGAELLNRELLAIPHESSSTQQPMVAAARRVIETQTSAPEGNIRARTILALRSVTQIPELFTSTDEVLDTIKVLAAEQTLSNQALLALGQLLRLFRVPTESISKAAQDLDSARVAQTERFYVFGTASELCELIKTEVVPFLKLRRGKEERVLKIIAELMEVARLSGVKEASASPRLAFQAASKFMNEHGDNALPVLFLCHVACQHGKTINSVLSHAFRRMMKDPSGICDAFYWYSSLKPGQNEIDISHLGLIEGIAQWKRARSQKWIDGRKECADFVSKRLDELKSPHGSGIQALPSDRLKGASEEETDSARNYLHTSQIYHLCNISTTDRRLEIHTVLSPQKLNTWLKEERTQLMKALENPSTWSRSLFSRSPISSELLIQLLGVLHPENPENNTFDLPLVPGSNDQRQRLVVDVRRSPTPRAVREVTRVLMGLASVAPNARRASGEAPFSIAQDCSVSPLTIPMAEPIDASRYSKELPMISYGIILREFSGIFSEGRDIGVAGAVHQLRQLAIKLRPDSLTWRRIVTSNRGGIETLLELLKCPEPLPSSVERTLKVGITALVPQENLPDGIELLADPYAPPLSRVIVSLEFLKVAKRTFLRHAQDRRMQSAQQDLLRSFSRLFDISLLDSMESEMKPREKVGSNRGIEGFFTNASLLDYIGHMSDTCATRRYSVRGERSNMALLVLIDPQAPLNCPAVVGAVGVIGAEGTINGKTVRCLMLRGVNPRASLLRTVPAAAFYRRIVARVAQLGVANGFDYIVAPDDDRTGMTLSNRRELVHYQSEHFSNPDSNPMIMLKDVDSIRFNTYPRFDPREDSREWACRVIGRCEKLAQGNF